MGPKNNTIAISKDDAAFSTLEDIIKKLAIENNIDNVESINIFIDKKEGTVSFKTAFQGPVEEEQQEPGLPPAEPEEPLAEAGPDIMSAPVQDDAPTEPIGEPAKEEMAEGVDPEEAEIAKMIEKQLGIAPPEKVDEKTLEEAQGWLSEIDNLMPLPKEEPQV